MSEIVGVNVEKLEKIVWKVVAKIKGDNYTGENIYYIMHVYKDIWVVVSYVTYDSPIDNQQIHVETGHFARFYKPKGLRKFLREIGVSDEDIKAIFGICSGGCDNL